MLDNESPRSTTFDRVSPPLLKHSHWKFALLRVTSRITYTSRIKYHLLLADFSFAPQRSIYRSIISKRLFSSVGKFSILDRQAFFLVARERLYTLQGLRDEEKWFRERREITSRFLFNRNAINFEPLSIRLGSNYPPVGKTRGKTERDIFTLV